MAGKRIVLACCLLGVFVATSGAQEEQAGLLGKRYVAIEATLTRPGEDLIRAIDSTAFGFGLAANLPVHEKVDVHLSLGGVWLSGDLYGIPLKETDYLVAATVLWHFLPGSEIDPFVGGGLAFSWGEAKTTIGGWDIKVTDDDVGVRITGGAEFAFTDATSLAALLAYSSLWDDDISLECLLNHWFNDTFALTLGVGYSFDNENLWGSVAAVMAL